MIDFFKLFKSLGLFGNGGRYSVTRETVTKIKREWENIDNLLKLKTPTHLRQALIAADKTLDNALRDIVPGESMSERLKAAKDKFDVGTYSKIWEAHKLRNNLVHESGFEPTYIVLKESVQNLRDALYYLGVKI